MKPSRWITAAQAWLLSCLLALGAVGCMATAFDLPLVSFPRVAHVTAWTALFCAAAFSLKGGTVLVMFAGVLGAGYLYHRTEFVQDFWQLVYRISWYYHSAYHWGVFKLVDTAWDAGVADLPMMVLGIAIAVITARPVCRGGGVFYPVALSFLALLTCMVVVDTVPSPEFLYCLLLGVILLLLSNPVRKHNLYQGDRLIFLTAVPTAVLLGLLFWAVPQEGYVDRTEELRQKMAQWLQELPGKKVVTLEEPAASEPGKAPIAVDLAALGSRRASRTPVLEVEAETGGPLYLRGQDYDIYEGTGWLAGENRVEPFGYAGVDRGYVAVETRQILDQLYLPYYPRGDLSLIGGKYDNLRIAKTYSFVRQGLPDNWMELAAREGSPADSAGRYLALPEDTRLAFEEMLAPILTEGMTAQQKAQAIGAFVRDSARYDQETDRMPEDRVDFALWFLQEAEAGYCVHFATAATVLLRAAELEARYVSGYLVAAPAEELVTVTGEQAHAWAEYYEPGLGAWVVLEATPPEGLPDMTETHPRETIPETVSTEAPETQPQTLGQLQTEPTFATLEATEPEAAIPMELPEETGETGAILLNLLALVLLVEGQRRLRLYLRWLRQNRGTPNRRALGGWREVEVLCKHLKETPPGALEALAQKAKFSQHTLTGEELAQFREFLAGAREKLKKRPWYRKWIDRWVLALY